MDPFEEADSVTSPLPPLRFPLLPMSTKLVGAIQTTIPEPASVESRSAAVLGPAPASAILPVDVDPWTGRPLGAAAPQIYQETNPSQKSTNSLLHHETHNIGLELENVRLTASPVPMSSQPSFLKGLEPSPWITVFRYLFMKTWMWVLGGIAFMLFGIGLSQAFILPRIYTCPPSSSCPESYDPVSSNVLQLLQTFMGYWLKAGVMFSSVGILQLSSYQAWFILMHQGNTVSNLDLSLGAIRGSVTDACYLLFKKNNHLLSLFVLSLIGIDTAISLITGLSITKAETVRFLSFPYNSTAVFPGNDPYHSYLAGQLWANEKVVTWALDDDQDHGSSALKGTMVRQDSRVAYAKDARPAGPRITGSFVCGGINNITEAPPSVGVHSYYIWVGATQYIARPDGMPLDVAQYPIQPAPNAMSYVWVSNTTGLIPNATSTKDGSLHLALCNHTLEMIPEEPREPGVEYIEPSTPFTSSCDSDDPNICVAGSVTNAILNWWGGIGTSFMHIRCRGGILGPIPQQTYDDLYCPLTQELWQATGVAMLDGIMQTAPSNLTSSQDLHARVQGLSNSRWWLNATIPAAMMVIYLIGLAYTCRLSRGDRTFKKLDLAEVVKAAQTDHIHELILAGQLKKAPVRYDSDVGFVNNLGRLGRLTKS